MKQKVITGNASDEYIVSYDSADQMSGGGGNDTLWGRAGDDQIQGNEGNDRLYGESGNDTLIGNQGDDRLNGGQGNDVYLYNRGDGKDTIENWDDSANNVDTIRFGEGIKAEEIQVIRRGNVWGWENHLILKLSESEQIVVENYFYEDGRSGHKLERIEFADGTSWDVEAVKQKVNATGFAPLVIDLDGDGLELISAIDSKVQVELDGKKQNIGWASSDDAVIAIDRNGDGQIDIQTETTFIHDKAGAQSDLEGLAGFDHNQDGQISAEDAVWAQLKTWQDQNGDGIAEQNEIKTLEQQNITRIDLQRQGSKVEKNGNTILGTTTAQMRDGTTKQIGDVVFNPVMDKIFMQAETKALSDELNGRTTASLVEQVSLVSIHQEQSVSTLNNEDRALAASLVEERGILPQPSGERGWLQVSVAEEQKTSSLLHLEQTNTHQTSGEMGGAEGEIHATQNLSQSSSTNLNATQTPATQNNTGELQFTEAELRAAFPLSYAAVKDAEQAKALGIDITPQPSKSKRGAQAVIDYYQAQEPKKTLTQSLIGLAKRMVGLESPDEKTKRINDANFFKMLIQFEDTCYMGIDKHGKPYNIPMLWKSSKYANPHYPIHLIEQEDRQAQLEEMFTRASNYPAYKAKMDQQAQAAEKNKAPPTQRELAEAETQRLHKQYASFMYERYSRLIASEQLGTSSAPLSAQTQFTSNQPSINTIAPMMGMGVDVKGK